MNQDEEAYKFVDQLISQIKFSNDEKKLTLTSSRQAKREFLTALKDKHAPTQQQELTMKTAINTELAKMNKFTIGQTSKYISKADLTYDEYMSIKSDFSSFEFS